MTAVEEERFEATAGPHLDELGYPRAVPRPSAESRRLAAEVRDAFTKELRSRGRPLPVRW